MRIFRNGCIAALALGLTVSAAHAQEPTSEATPSEATTLPDPEPAEAAPAEAATPAAAPAAEKAAPAAEKAAPAAEKASNDSDEGDEADQGGEGRSLLDELTDELDKEGEDEGWNVLEEEQPKTYPYIEHNGYFRFRADMFYRLHLGTLGTGANGETITTTGFYPPLTRNKVNSDPKSQLDGDTRDENTIAGANIRFRYSPTIHVADWLRVKTTFDVLDNIVLGSTPDYAYLRPDAPLVLFAGGQASPEAGRNALADAVRVKEAYAEINAIFGLLRAGRMASSWGLGILANGGTELDSDYGDYVDRVLLVTRLYGIYIGFAWDFVGEGLIAQDTDQFFGQPHDADQQDDVLEVVGTIFQRPMTQEEKDQRQQLLTVERKPAFDWGVYTVYRQQSFDAVSDNQPTYAPTVTSATGFPTVNTVTPETFDKFKMVKRNGWAVIPDVWMKFEWEPSFGQRLLIELEAAFIYGEVDQTVDNVEDAKQKTITQWGGVLKSSYETGGLLIGLEAGVASGDDAEYFGVLDRVNFAAGKDASAGGSGTVTNEKITNFKFDKNYYVDLIMFRELIGAVTNAYYVKPSVQYDLFDSADDALGGRVDIITAFAMEKDATPGNEAWYGIEFDASLFYEEKNKFRADLAWGTFVPGGAFDLIDGFNGSTNAIGAEFAMTLQGRIFLMF